MGFLILTPVFYSTKFCLASDSTSVALDKVEKISMGKSSSGSLSNSISHSYALGKFLSPYYLFS